MASSGRIADCERYIRLPFIIHRRADRIALPPAFQAEWAGAEGIGDRAVGGISVADKGPTGAERCKRPRIYFGQAG